MARPLRLKVADAFHHVTSRGNGRRDIFLDDEDRHQFLNLLGKTSAKHRLTIHAYALMPNHYHLLPHTLDENLSPSIQWLNSVYGQWFNRRHDRAGHLFQGRFHSTLVAGDRHFLAVSRYIHQNPCKAGLASAPKDYEWTSCRAFIKSVPIPSWLEPNLTLNLLNTGTDDGPQSFLEFMSQPQASDPFEESIGGSILAGQPFIAPLKELAHHTAQSSREFPHRQAYETRIEAGAVLRAVNRELGCVASDLNHAWSRKASHRALTAYLLRERAGLNLREIGRICGLSVSGACKMVASVRTRLRTEPELQETLGRVDHCLKTQISRSDPN
ncbi:MAG: transposase [Elusimicrobiota bacterium]|jgi:REP element-mobilizing transposase RayT/transposase-like protein